MTTENQNELAFLKNCLEDALQVDFIKITFKDPTQPNVTITKIEEYAGRETSMLVSETAISAYNVSTGQWIDIELDHIETAETVSIFRNT
jgi:hypothetical protein